MNFSRQFPHSWLSDAEIYSATKRGSMKKDNPLKLFFSYNQPVLNRSDVPQGLTS